MKKNILIAAPVYKREWILPKWFEFIENQDYPLSNIGFLFELGPDDDETHDILWNWHLNHPEVICFDAQIDDTRPHNEHKEGTRHWTRARYFNMVQFRNSLLERATAMADKFDYYFSLDTDLFLEDPQTLNTLVDDIQKDEVDVVSPLAYMTPKQRSHPSIMYWHNKPGGQAARRHDLFQKDSLYKVDIVMAAVFMSKPVFTRARYCWHKFGEDLGFATDLASYGFNSYTDTRIYLPHIMNRKMLEEYLDTGVDDRKP